MQSLSHRGFSAWITIDGEMLPVHQQEAEGPVCSAWIASTAGQYFSVWWKDDSKARIATSGHIFIDGHDVASAIMRPGRSKPVERKGAKISPRRLKPFTFSVLRLTDDDAVANKNDPSVKEVGTIKIEITRVRLGDEVPFKGYGAEDHGMVHEKAKKMGAHCTSYGPDQRTASTRTTAVTTVPYDGANAGPHVAFIFKYKSQDLLRADGIIRAPNNKRRSPQNDEEVIVISGSEDGDSDKENPTDGRPTKRPKITEATASQRTQSSDTDSGNMMPKVESAEGTEDSQAGNFGTPFLQQAEQINESQTQADEDTQFASETPSLPQQQAEQDESQTQADDDTQLTFGAPSLLQQEIIRENALLNPKEAAGFMSVEATEDVSKRSEAMKVVVANSPSEEVTQAAEDP